MFLLFVVDLTKKLRTIMHQGFVFVGEVLVWLVLTLSFTLT